jgi:hypothetical protein
MPPGTPPLQITATGLDPIGPLSLVKGKNGAKVTTWNTAEYFALMIGLIYRRRRAFDA